MKAGEDLYLEGKQAIADMLRSDMHQSLLPNCAHTTGPVSLSVNGDTAQALGYSRLYRQMDGTPQLMRLAVNHWQFRRKKGGWKICKRVSRLLGEAQAQELLRHHLQDFTAL